jgi:hypothetical protein
LVANVAASYNEDGLSEQREIIFGDSDAELDGSLALHFAAADFGPAEKS